MDAEISQSEQWLRFIAWLEDNWSRVAAVAAVVIAAGIVVAYVIWQGGQKQRHASQQLSQLLVGAEEPSGETLLGFAELNAGTVAGTRATLLAAGALFTEGRFEEAQAEFERFLAAQGPGPLTSRARLGIAACRAAQGQTEGAISDYKALVENPANGNVIPMARFALALLYMEQSQTDLARTQYEELANLQGTSLAGEARMRLLELPPSAQSQQVEIPTLTIPSGVTN